MKMREAIKTMMLVSLVIVALTGCGGIVPPVETVENPFIEVTSPKDGDVIDGKDGYLEVTWTTNDLHSPFVDIDFICADNEGVQIGGEERIGSNIPASDEYFVFGPDIASWIMSKFGKVPDICQVKVTECESNFDQEWNYSEVFIVTFD